MRLIPNTASENLYKLFNIIIDIEKDKFAFSITYILKTYKYSGLYK